MANTTNFNWETPDDTDLVKDGALAIRTLGSAIDTSLVDLKGGTTGQVLSKTSNTDMDFTWVAQDDADAIQKSLIDAEGDLIVGDAADAVQRLAIGSNGNVLTVDTTVDGKIKWAAPAGGSTFVGASATNSATQSIANNTHTAVTWDTEQFDTDAFHSTSSNTSRFTIPAGKGGKYLFNCSVRWDNNASSDRILEIYKNGSIFCVLDVLTGNYPGYMISRTLELVATDYVELYVYQNSGGSRTLELGSTRGWAELLYLGA